MPMSLSCRRSTRKAKISTMPRAMVKDAITSVLEERGERVEEIPRTGWALVEPVEIAA